MIMRFIASTISFADASGLVIFATCAVTFIFVPLVAVPTISVSP